MPQAYRSFSLLERIEAARPTGFSRCPAHLLRACSPSFTRARDQPAAVLGDVDATGTDLRCSCLSGHLLVLRDGGLSC